jgi:3',5'-cyclic AMP phosphodiesterase CpdA
MRIVAVSDQHGCMPELPEGDLLIVAGDICPDQVRGSLAMLRPDLQAAWFNRMIRPWAAAAPVRQRVLTWGNHDWCGEACDFSQDSPAVSPAAPLHIVVDDVVHVRSDPAAADAHVASVWATPWCTTFIGDWAFLRPADELARIYARIPEGIDVLVSHQPPYGYGDRVTDISGDSVNVGSRELLEAIDRVKPRVVICGHVHSGHGRYEHNGIPIYNVSVVNNLYRQVYEPTVIDLPPR